MNYTGAGVGFGAAGQIAGGCRQVRETKTAKYGRYNEQHIKKTKRAQQYVIDNIDACLFAPRLDVIGK